MEDQEADIGFWHGIVPPAIMPLSDRAKEHMDLPEHCDAVVLIDGPDRVLASFPDGYSIVAIGRDEGPHTLAVGTTLFTSDLH
jgi:hypothetical protein